ncbi:MAG: aldo/keto reductase [Kiritimatiellia bacterium]
MQFQILPHTDLRVSRISFGCWAIVCGFNWGPQDERDSLSALWAAFDAGVNFFDTSEAYGDGESERLLQRALGDVRDKIVIATKVSPRHYAPTELVAACERSLRNLGTDYIDLYQLHWPNPSVNLSETLQNLEKLKASGKIRAYGVSNFGKRDLQSDSIGQYRVSSNQVAYNLLFRAVEFEILPFCRQLGLPLLAYSPLMQGLLTGKFVSLEDVPAERRRIRHYSSTHPGTLHGEPGAESETFAAVAAIRRIAERLDQPMGHVAIAWLLAQPGVACVIGGARNAAQARFNAQAADLHLAREILDELNQVTELLKQKLGPNADMWQSASRIH